MALAFGASESTAQQIWTQAQLEPHWLNRYTSAIIPSRIQRGLLPCSPLKRSPTEL